jgi:hypothetical protein
MVARARGPANAAFPRRAVTTLGNQQVSGLEYWGHPLSLTGRWDTSITGQR